MCVCVLTKIWCPTYSVEFLDKETCHVEEMVAIGSYSLDSTGVSKRLRGGLL